MNRAILIGSAMVSSLLVPMTPAAAADWWFVSSGGSEETEIAVFVDMESIYSDRSNNRSAWAYYIKEQLDSGGERKAKSLQRFDCALRTMTLLSRISIGNNDRIIRSTTWKSYEQSADYVVPDSVGEGVWQFVCNGANDGDLHLEELSPEQFAAKFFKM